MGHVLEEGMGILWKILEDNLKQRKFSSHLKYHPLLCFHKFRAFLCTGLFEVCIPVLVLLNDKR